MTKTIGRVSRKKMNGKIYFIRAEKLGLIKIGFTMGIVSKRIKTIQGNSPDKLIFIKSISGSMWDEIKLHERFSEYNSHLEWYFPNEKLLEYINGAD